jgi:hypothetical protein
VKSYDVLGYTFPGYAVCLDCHLKVEHECGVEDSCYPIFADSEWDYIPACDICGEAIEGVRITEEFRSL